MPGNRVLQILPGGSEREEIDILIEERVELNAMASDDLVEMIERKLKDYGLQKVVPDDELLADAYKIFHRSNELKKKFEEIAEEFEDIELTVPKNLRKRVAATLKKHPELRWDDAVRLVLDNTQLDHVRQKKREAKTKSGDFSDADEEEDDE